MQIAEQHRRRPQQHLAERHHRKFQRKSSCLPHTFFHPVGNFAKMRIARRQFRPGIANPDDRASIEQVVRPALILDPASIYEAHLVLPHKPFVTSQFFHFRPVAAVLDGGV